MIYRPVFRAYVGFFVVVRGNNVVSFFVSSLLSSLLGVESVESSFLLHVVGIFPASWCNGNVFWESSLLFFS